MAASLYAPQRVNFKPTQPASVSKMIDPKKILIESLKKLMEKNQQRLMSQDPAAVMGAVTNPSDVSKGMRGNVLGGVEVRARMMGGGG